MKKKVFIITGSRSEYGLLKNLIIEIKKIKKFQTKLIATGMHYSKKHGSTFKEITNDGFKINYKINLNLKGDSNTEVTKSIGTGIKLFTKIFSSDKPDLIIILGDRHEILPPAIVSLILRIPVAHISGGEITEGAIDNSIRHCLTKLSHFHFVASAKYKRRVIQMGELPKNIFVTGGLGVDAIKNTNFLNKRQLEKKLNFKFREENTVVTFHPVTLENNSSKKQFKQILLALNEFKKMGIIFTMPNNDPGYSPIFNMIKSFVKKNKNSKYYVNLGHLKYFSCLKYSKYVLGNSSSAIHEVPSFKIPSINVGNRQKGRIKSSSTINCKPEKKSIMKAFKKADLLYKSNKLTNVKNPYGIPGSSKKISKILKNLKLNNVIQKKFFDINF
tara:strand:- start:174 stop:1334 length:1161 start_codon:yes stop_codon:yes gene_type:complete